MTEAMSKFRSVKAVANRHNPAREVMTTLKFSNEGLGNMRDHELESELQGAMDSGHRVWVVGDIHGYLETFEALVDRLDLSEGDHVLCVGDLIDRGPGSRGVLEMVSNHPRIHSIRGNHEESMRLSLSPRHKGTMMKSWLKYGGVQTLESFSSDTEEAKSLASEYLPFIEALPTLVVLRNHIVVHAGFDISKPISEQKERDMMWDRSIFSSRTAIDPSRQIVVGHTTIQDLVTDPTSGATPDIWFSESLLDDGETPSVVGIDSGIYLDEHLSPRLTAFELISGEVISHPRVQ
jgi:serine/threonine protein phosphatase 1